METLTATEELYLMGMIVLSIGGILYAKYSKPSKSNKNTKDKGTGA